MADTYQDVRWALERPCPMRQGENWFLPERTREQLLNIRRYNLAKKKEQILGDICVWGEFGGGKHNHPDLLGFQISDMFARIGGIQAIKQNCRSCEANVQFSENRKKQLAGCFDSFYMLPNNHQVIQTIQENGLVTQLQSLFLLTDPIWFGLWVNSPLTIEQCKFLSILLPNFSVNEYRKKDVQRFLGALSIAINQGFNIHVSLAPPGHVDLGWYTIFKHCPRCKAGWNPKHKNSRLVTCQVCNYLFDPDSTHSRELDDTFDEPLEKQLDKESYHIFVKEYLKHRGYSQTEIDKMYSPPDDEIIRQLVNTHSDLEIATLLNEKGRTTMRDRPYTKADVHNLRHRLKIWRNSEK